MSRHFALFDSLRGLAVLSVVGFHVASLTGRLGEGPSGRVLAVLGGEAVIVFFVISGFLLYRPFLAARAAGRRLPDTRTFLYRRAFRIVPAYWAILTLLAIYPGVVGPFGDGWWRYYLFAQVYDSDTVLRGLPVAWTLCIEVTFYLLLPVWAAAARRVPGGRGEEGWVRSELAALAVVSAGGIAVQLLAARQIVGRTLADTIVGQFPWMALGMALAVASVVAARRTGAPWWVRVVERRSGAIWLAGGAAMAGLAALVPPNGLLGLLAAVTTVRPLSEAVAHVVLSAILATAFVLPAVFGERAGGVPRRILALRPVAWIGVVSYSVYLWHLTLAELIAVRTDPYHFTATGLGLLEHVQGGSTAILMVLTVAASCAAAAVTYYGIERPFINRSHGRPATADAARQAASGAYPSGNAEGAKNQHSTA